MTRDVTHRHVREARPGEHRKVAALLRAAYREHARSIPDGLYEGYLADLVRVGPGATVLVALRGREIAGTARLYVAGSASGLSIPPHWALVRAVAVHPEHRRAGHARTLMAAAAHRAAGAGAPVLALHTAPFMHAAIRLYEGLGFVRAPELDFSPDADRTGGPGRVLVRGYALSLVHQADRVRATA
jgi:ribosomal protein S18 acetylase RimI-like enzyme